MKKIVGYGLIAALISAIVIGTVVKIGEVINKAFSMVSSALN